MDLECVRHRRKTRGYIVEDHRHGEGNVVIDVDSKKVRR